MFRGPGAVEGQCQPPGPILATMAEEFAARQGPDGVWVDAAAWLVTAGCH